MLESSFDATKMFNMSVQALHTMYLRGCAIQLDRVSATSITFYLQTIAFHDCISVNSSVMSYTYIYSLNFFYLTPFRAFNEFLTKQTML